LRKRFALRQGSLVHLGRSAALVIGTCGEHGNDFRLTVTAATSKPAQLHFAKLPSAEELHRALDAKLPTDAWFDDVNGSIAYKRHVTRYFAEQIRAELA
jgi:hypothetical protein